MKKLRLLLSALALVIVNAVAMAGYSLTPPAGKTFSSIYEAENFNLTFDTGTSVTLSANAKATLNTESGNEYTSIKVIDFSAQMGQPTYIFKFDCEEFDENGEYILDIPAGTFTVAGQSMEAISATYTMDDSSLGGAVAYPEITLVSSDPADGSTIEGIGQSAVNKISFVTSNDAAVNYIGWSVWDVTDELNPEYVRQSSENRIDLNRNGSNDDIWTDVLYISIGGPTDSFIKGHKYRFDLTFAGIGYNPDTNQYPSPREIEASTELTTSIYYYGSTEATEYSPYSYVSVSPDPDNYKIETAAQGLFTVVYSGNVKPCAFNYAISMATATAGTWAPVGNVDADGYCDRWEFTMFPSVVNECLGQMYVTIQTKDKNGLYVKGNGGFPLNDFNYGISWNCNAGAPDIIAVSPEDGATVTSLSEIVVSNSADQVMAISYNGGPARICDMFGGEIRVLSDAVVADGNEKQMKWTFEPITKEGRYVLIIPEYYFSIGEEMEGSSSKITTFTYTVEKAQEEKGVKYDLVPASVTPEPSSTLEELTEVVLAFNDVTFYPSWVGSVSGTLYKLSPGAETEVATVDGQDNDFFNPTIYTFKFGAPVTEEGSYVFRIAKGAFCDEEYDINEGTSGHVNDVLEYYFTVSQGSAIVYDLEPSSVTPTPGSTLTELTKVVLSFDDATFYDIELGAPAGTLYILDENGEREVASATGVEDDWFVPTDYTFTFSEPITENGSYLFRIEKGLLYDENYEMTGGTEGRANDKLEYYFIISSGSSTPSVTYDIEPAGVTPDPSTTLTEISEVVLTFNDVTFYPMFSNAPEGILYKVEAEGELEVAKATAVEDDFFDPKVYTFTFSTPVNEDGIYAFRVAKGSFCDDAYDYSEGAEGRANDDLEYIFTISSHDGISTVTMPESTLLNVFNLKGESLIRNGGAESLQTLPAGIYIVNGKKIVVK